MRSACTRLAAVAAAVALLGGPCPGLAVEPFRDPSLTPDQIRTHLIETADKIGSEPYNAEGFAPMHAYG